MEDQGRYFRLNECKLFRGIVGRRDYVIRDGWANLVQDVGDDHINVQEDFLDGRRSVYKDGRDRANSLAWLCAGLHAGHRGAAAVIANLSEIGSLLEVRSGLGDCEECAEGER